MCLKPNLRCGNSKLAQITCLQPEPVAISVDLYPEMYAQVPLLVEIGLLFDQQAHLPLLLTGCFELG